MFDQVNTGPHRDNLTLDFAELRRLRLSALWAAYGDALGFISELTDENGLKRRLGGEPLYRTISWRRRVGGRSGVQAELPAGCYSDDTQLRLATSRAITNRVFDVEAFAKVELPVWTAFALGGGKSTKSAATNLAKASTAWFANTFAGWIGGGGNGAAMRIQPHVWANWGSAPFEDTLRDVLRNAVCTHGHPVGILGAVIHAKTLHLALESGRAPGFAEVIAVLESSFEVPQLLIAEPQIGDVWMGQWERAASASFEMVWKETVEEAIECQRRIRDVADYPGVLAALGLFDPDKRGSGVLTSLAAAALVALSQSADDVVVQAATAVGSDTDTIGTMAGAIVGSLVEHPPSGHVMDAELIVAEVDRHAGSASGAPPSAWYPDLLSWNAPRTQADSLVDSSGTPFVLGLGPVDQVLSDPVWDSERQFGWQWMRLVSGQSILVKRREKLAPLSKGNAPARVRSTDSVSGTVDAMITAAETRGPIRAQANEPERRSVDLQVVFRYLEEHNFSDQAVGLSLRRVAESGTTEQQAAFVATVLSRFSRRR